MAVKGSKVEDVEIEITESRANAGRIKLPARMFLGKYESVIIEGHEIEQCESDQNRSLPFSINLFGDTDEGDVLTFSHVKGNRWDVEIATTGKRKAKKPQLKAKGTSKKVQADDEEVPVKKAKLNRTEGQKKGFQAVAKKFAQIAIKNANKGFVNENIQEHTTMDVDARIYFTSLDNKRFRKEWKYGYGLTLKEAVRQLNLEVYSD